MNARELDDLEWNINHLRHLIGRIKAMPVPKGFVSDKFLNEKISYGGGLSRKSRRVHIIDTLAMISLGGKRVVKNDERTIITSFVLEWRHLWWVLQNDYRFYMMALESLTKSLEDLENEYRKETSLKCHTNP